MTMAMTADERERFLAGLHVAVLSVADGDGRGPLSMPVWYLYEPGGEILFATGRDSRKMDLIRQARRVSLVVQNEAPPYGYASVEGPVTAIEAATPDQRRTLAERYLSPEQAALYLESTKDIADTIDVVRIRPERWLTRDYAKQDG
ncbi:pyridoxamine 5'-phosphate oxidase family protein [Actinomadura sp. KC345]|uniref:pyridoxamine 5'-phosphate oxidase family protein n=1 Tax=Actinomadura sp. KC345 TaxID=2530371 RepID=UPI001FB5CF05|nr:pyridoxamine 5'-phosphate oxidase family protein [Actinomadura sp. KC345]